MLLAALFISTWTLSAPADEKGNESDGSSDDGCISADGRFVVFVNRRPKREILEVLRARIDRPTDEELETALGELVAIAEDRWVRR
jgi:hypothetical protein